MPPVKKKPEEQQEQPAITTVGSFVTPGEPVLMEPGAVELVEKQKPPLIFQFEESLLRLGIYLATGMHEKTRFPSTAEVAGIDALCKLYGTLKGYHGN